MDGSLDRARNRKVTLPQAHRVIQSLDVETSKTTTVSPHLTQTYDETVIRPPQRSSLKVKNQTPEVKVTVKKTATLPAQYRQPHVEKQNPQSDVSTLLRTYKKVNYFPHFIFISTLKKPNFDHFLVRVNTPLKDAFAISSFDA